MTDELPAHVDEVVLVDEWGHEYPPMSREMYERLTSGARFSDLIRSDLQRIADSTHE